MAVCCRTQFLLRASCYNNGAVNGALEVASVRRQQDVIAVGRCFWLTGPFKCWAVQEKIRSGFFLDAWRGGNLIVLYRPCCSGSWSLSKSTLARTEPQGQNSFRCMQPPLTLGSCWWDAALGDRQEGWKGQACWSSFNLSPAAIPVQEKPLLNGLNRNFAKSCQLWVKKKAWPWCFGFA